MFWIECRLNFDSFESLNRVNSEIYVIFLAIEIMRRMKRGAIHII